MEQQQSNSNPNPNIFERFNHWVSSSVLVRIFSITILVLLLMIPNAMIRDIIHERQRTNDEAIREVSSKWGNSQTVLGPVISVPYLKYKEDKDGKREYYRKWSHFLPEDLRVSGNVSTEYRKRGIYKVVVYDSELKVSGNFKKPDPLQLGIDPSTFLINEAVVSIGIPDMRGISKKVELVLNDTTLEFGPGVPHVDIISEGISTNVNLSEDEDYSFSIDLELQGSQQLHFVPLAKETNVNISSDWPHPSFNGAFLPDEYNVTDDGFTSDWKVLDLNRNFPQAWLGQRAGVYESSFGFELYLPNDHYQQNMRSAKYAILFIALTFLVFFFIETVNKKRIHPIQYILVGFALSIFFVLLLSISEHIGFNAAYGLSAVGTTLLIIIYSSHMLSSRKLTVFMGGLLTIMYGFIYTILQLEDMALLVGSIGLFLILAAVMLWSRKVDWYGNK